MLGLSVSITGFLGLATALSRLGRIRTEHAPFVAVSCLGILLFLFSLAGLLRPGAVVLALAGVGFAAYFTWEAWWQGQWSGRRTAPHILIFAGLLLFSFVLSLGMVFTVVDDFVFWGILGKSLVMFDRLPGPDTTIIPRHLTYTPGCGLIHYYFHLFSNQYIPARAYFGQAVILVSAFYTLADRREPAQSVLRLSIAVFLFSILAGSVFFKLQVDFLLSAVFLGGLWVCLSDDPPLRKAVVLCLPVCFLFLIKQVGALLALVLLVVAATDLFFCTNAKVSERIRAGAVLAAAALFLACLKMLWAQHCSRMGFTAFNEAMNWPAIWAALDIFSPGPAREGFAIFIRSVLFGEADRLNLPYLAWYIALAWIWVRLFKGMAGCQRSRYGLVLGILGGFFLVYLAMLYFLQIVVFGVGTAFDHTVGMDRYMNIFFTQAVCFTFLTWADQNLLTGRTLRTLVILLLVPALALPTASRIKARMRPDPADQAAAAIAGRISEQIPGEARSRICIVPGQDDHHLGIKLRYHLMPHLVRISSFPLDTEEKFRQALPDYDYVLFFQADTPETSWASAWSEDPVESKGFYRISSTGNTIALKKIF